MLTAPEIHNIIMEGPFRVSDFKNEVDSKTLFYHFNIDSMFLALEFVYDHDDNPIHLRYSRYIMTLKRRDYAGIINPKMAPTYGLYPDYQQILFKQTPHSYGFTHEGYNTPTYWGTYRLENQEVVEYTDSSQNHWHQSWGVPLLSGLTTSIDKFLLHIRDESNIENDSNLIILNDDKIWSHKNETEAIADYENVVCDEQGVFIQKPLSIRPTNGRESIFFNKKR